ncbi:Rieske (2Fe-2S) protein [bacterium]|nr:Rieske (2Fe-2S) protein [bacterium]
MEKHKLNISDMESGEVRIMDLTEETSIIVVKENDNYYAFKNLCPHQSRKMGNVELCGLSEIRCEHHGMKFNIKSGENTYSAGYFGIPKLDVLKIEIKDAEYYIQFPD